MPTEPVHQDDEEEIDLHRSLQNVLRRIPRDTQPQHLAARLDALVDVLDDPTCDSAIPDVIDDDPSNSSLVYHIEEALNRRSA